MNHEPTKNKSQSSKTRIVEIVGPAGAGKTTLYKALERYTEFVRLENFPNVRRLGDAPFFIWNGMQLIPSLIPLYYPKSRQMTRREFAWMTILKGWSALLRKQVQEDDRVIILDQGPVYLLAEMRLFGPEYLKQKSAERLWQDLYVYWSTTVDMILWLDGADEILLDRIRNRHQDLCVKDQPAAIVYDYLNRYRMEYEFVVSRLIIDKPGLKVLKFDTGDQKTEPIVKRIMSELSGVE